MNLTQKIAMHVLAISLTIGSTYYLTDQYLKQTHYTKRDIAKTVIQESSKEIKSFLDNRKKQEDKNHIREEKLLDRDWMVTKIRCDNKILRCREKDCIRDCDKYGYSGYDILGAARIEEGRYCACISWIK